MLPKISYNSNNYLKSPFFWVMYCINLFFFSSYSSLNLLPPFLSNLGASKTYIGLFMNITALELVLFVVFFGTYSNKINKKKSLLIGYTLFILSSLLMFIYHNNLIVLLFLRIINSIGFTFGYTMHTNIIFEILPKEKRSSGIALYGTSGILSNLLGTFVAENVLKILPHTFMFIQGSIFSILCIILILIINEPHNNYKEKKSISFWNVIYDKNLLPIIITSIVFGGVFSIIVSFLPNYTFEKFRVINLSYYFLSYTFIAIFLRIFSGKFLDELPKKKLIIFSLSTMFLSILVIIFFYKISHLIIIGLLYGFGHSIMYPILSSIFVNYAKDDEKNIYNNTYISLNTFGSIFLSTLFGFFGDIFGTIYIFILIGILIILNIIFLLFAKINYSKV